MQAHTPHRQLYMVLSPHSLSYASLALESLFANSDEGVDLHLITDSTADRQALIDAVSALQPPAQHRWSVAAEADLDDAASDIFTNLPHLRAFRKGHPCWRKITDPLLLSNAGEELILLDPDLYFPNRFCFEPTPAEGLLLMWQRPNCLLPADVVRTALNANIALARHVDIGVSHWRAQVDLNWLDWLIGKLGGVSLPRAMHVEAIVWAAIAMRQGGGYLDPAVWNCWHRTQIKRVKRKLGVSGPSILAQENWSAMKCLHAGGEAKHWIAETRNSGKIPPPTELLHAGAVRPFVELTPSRYNAEQDAKSALRSLGYYHLFGAGQG